MVKYDVVNTPIVDIVNQIILYASKSRASDIHMDPKEDNLLIRMRIDGELNNHTIIPKVYERNLITRVKLISNMNITETRLPQDGAIKGKIEGKDLDIRVSVLPTNSGEKVVMRILDYSKSLEGIESLGFSEKNFKLLKKMIETPNGIILVTGATGSGKSTTTYSILQALNKENVNIITVEDPIEMNIEGINQVQVNSEIGLTFANVLRSILRQDPNIILIGEIRDSETAQIAVRASITGHLVLSTLHTNNSLSTIERLLDMDVERYLLSSALTGIISQKLARRLCPKCRTLRPTTDYEKEVFKLVLNKDVKEVYEPKGCNECSQGYYGRIAIEEVLYINDELRNIISNDKTSKQELKDLIYTDEVTTLLGDGLEKILIGITTFDEIFKLIEVDLEMKSLRESAARKTKDKENKKNTTEIIISNIKDEPTEIIDEEIIQPTEIITNDVINKPFDKVINNETKDIPIDKANTIDVIDKPIDKVINNETKDIPIDKVNTIDVIDKPIDKVINNETKDIPIDKANTIDVIKKEPSKPLFNLDLNNDNNDLDLDTDIDTEAGVDLDAEFESKPRFVNKIIPSINDN